MAESHLDVLSVGDVVIDAFIKLFDESERVERRDDGTWLALPFATKVPFDHAEVIPAVGNASNASVAFAKLGLSSGLISNVGHDQHGQDILNALHKAKVDTRFVRINPDKLTN